MNPLISVIVPVYNVQEYLDQCLSSIANQIYTNIEVIIVNDGSTDGSLAICNKWQKNDDRFTVITEENGGLSRARNNGYMHSHGEYILFVDSDDWLDDKMVSCMLGAFQRNNADMVTCQYMIVKNDGERIISYKAEKNEKVVKKEEYIKLLLEDKEITNHIWRKMFKRSKLPKILFNDGHNFEDMDAMPRLLENCNFIVCLSQALYFYRMRSSSIIYNLSTKNIFDYYNAINNSLSEYSKMVPRYSFRIEEIKFKRYHDTLKKIVQVDKDCNVLDIQKRVIKYMKMVPCSCLTSMKDKILKISIQILPNATLWGIKMNHNLHVIVWYIENKFRRNS